MNENKLDLGEFTVETIDWSPGDEYRCVDIHLHVPGFDDPDKYITIGSVVFADGKLEVFIGQDILVLLEGEVFDFLVEHEAISVDAAAWFKLWHQNE